MKIIFTDTFLTLLCYITMPLSFAGGIGGMVYLSSHYKKSILMPLPMLAGMFLIFLCARCLDRMDEKARNRKKARTTPTFDEINGTILQIYKDSLS